MRETNLDLGTAILFYDNFRTDINSSTRSVPAFVRRDAIARGTWNPDLRDPRWLSTGSSRNVFMWQEHHCNTVRRLFFEVFNYAKFCTLRRSLPVYIERSFYQA